MPWIKKNLTLVLGGLVGLILLGGTGFFLYSEMSREAAINAQLEEKRGEWTTLNDSKPFPDDKNIRFTKEEVARLEKLADSLRQTLKPVETPPVHDTFALRLLIERTISDLTREAEEAGVNLPNRYAFTFQRLRDLPGQFDSNAIPALAEQVTQVSTLARILFNAKIHSLDTLRRAPVLKDEGSGSDYLTKKSVTNQWVVRTPYDLSFKTFSGELAKVLRSIAALDQAIIIKTVNVEPTSLPQTSSAAPVPILAQPTAPAPGGPPGPGGMDAALRARYGLGPGGGRPGEGGGPQPGMDPSMRSRYGLGPVGGAGSRYGGGPGGGGGAPPPSLMTPTQPGVGLPAPAPSGPSVVLDEKPLRVILQLDFVKPKPVAEAARRAPAPRTAPAAGDGATDASGATAAEKPAE